MNLLIVTQAVDQDDSILGFFHRWVEEFAKYCKHIHVICLKEGRHQLPANVTIHSLGKERGRPLLGSIIYAWRFLSLAWKLRHEYDAVFVHMNQEYVLLGGFVWRLWRKRVVLWRNHKKGSLLTKIAIRLSHEVCYTSPQAYVANAKNSVRMPIGIDTDAFRPTGNRMPHSILFLGRFDPVKRVDMFVDALKILHAKGLQFHASIYGDPTPGKEAYAERVRVAAAPLVEAGVLALHGSVKHADTPKIFSSHEIYANLTQSGSFDKTIGEAMACGCVIVAANDALQNMPEVFYIPHTLSSITAATLDSALQLPYATHKERVLWIEEEHSLTLVIRRLLDALHR